MENSSHAAHPSDTVIENRPPKRTRQGEQFVWPWMGILVNIQGEMGKTSVEEQISLFNPLKIHPLWNLYEHTWNAIVEFSKDWDGLKDAFEFEKFFGTECLGKKDWKRNNHHVPKIYGWVARYDDYNSECSIGEHLRKAGHLKTISEITKEESRKADELVANLTSQIEVKIKEFQELECKYRTTKMSLDNMMNEYDTSKRVMEKKLSLAQKDNENLTRLFAEQMKEKESLLKRILRQQDEKHMLELEELNEQIKENVDMLDYLQDSNQTLSFKLCPSNDNLQEVRKALITVLDLYLQGLKETQTGRAAIIGIKRMGELDDRPFKKVCNQRFGKDDADFKALELSSKWQELIKNPQWHPYKITKIDGIYEEIIDEEDERLKGLKAEYGDAVYDAVTTALLEMKEYNPLGRCIISELWNFREKREASLGEVLEHMFEELKTLKRKR